MIQLRTNCTGKYLLKMAGKIRFASNSLADLSAYFCNWRDGLDLGASQMPKGFVLDSDGSVIGHISYNGRVWAGVEYAPNASPLYDNRTA